MTLTAAAPVYDPSRAEVIADPYPALLALQSHDPAHFSPHLKAWVLTRHDDVRGVLNSAEMSVDRIGPFYRSLPEPARNRVEELCRYLSLWLVFRDPPEHTRLRRLMGRAFTMTAVEGMREGVETLTDMLADRLPAGKPVDFVAEFAMQLPALVIMDLLGVPRDRMPEIKGWSDEMQLFIGSARNTPDKYERAAHGAHEMAALFRDLIAERRAAPREDLISRFIAAREADDAMSEDELIASCMLVLFGGHETTTNLLSTGLMKFIAHPEARARLAADPGLAGLAVEECLRLDGPSGAMARVVGRDHVLHGKTLRAGDRVFAMINAANQDPEIFDRPGEFDIDRKPNRHVAFGYGAHFCMGSALARLEGEVAFTRLCRRFPNMRFADEAPSWHETIIMRGPKRLPVVLD